MHGLAWLPDALDVEQILVTSGGNTDSVRETLIQHVDRIVSTVNPAVLPDGSQVLISASHNYAEVEDFDQDLADLIATCQRHTHCSAAYNKSHTYMTTPNKKVHTYYHCVHMRNNNVNGTVRDTEPTLQPITGEALHGASAIADDGARLDVAANIF